MGGTLAHPRPSFNGLLSQVCRREGLDVSLERAITAEPAVWGRIAAQLNGGRGFSLSPERSHEFWLWVYGVFLEELGFPDARHVPQRLFDAFIRPENYQPFDDTLPALTRLHEQGFNIGIISNWEAWAGDLLRVLGLADLLDYTVVSGSVGFEKPDPEIFQFALAAADVPPAQAMHVGDNPVDDVEGALRAGMHAVLIDRGLAPGVREDTPRSVRAPRAADDTTATLYARIHERRAPLIPQGPGVRSTLATESVTVGSLLEIPRLLGAH